MTKTEKLYKVNLRGFTYNTTRTPLSPSYVIAYDTEEAYQKVRKWLDDNKYGYPKDRELDSIELIAENDVYTNTKARLFL